MIPLATTQHILTWLSVCPADESTSTQMKLAYGIFTSFVSISNLCGSTAILFFFIKAPSNRLEDYVFATIGLVAFCSIIYGMVVVIFSRSKINDIFTELSTIYNASKCSLNQFSSKYSIIRMD